jgi:hypothetical protein
VPVAVVLHFVEPVRSVRDLGRLGGDAEIKRLKHGTKKGRSRKQEALSLSEEVAQEGQRWRGRRRTLKMCMQGKNARSIICAAPSYLERCGVPRKPADLAKHVCIVAVPSSPWPFRAREGRESLKILPRVTSDNGEAALQLALDGVGIVRLADIIVGEAIRLGRLVPRTFTSASGSLCRPSMRSDATACPR